MFSNISPTLIYKFNFSLYFSTNRIFNVLKKKISKLVGQVRSNTSSFHFRPFLEESIFIHDLMPCQPS